MNIFFPYSNSSELSFFRFLKLNPLAREDFIEYLRKVDQLDEAAKQLAKLVSFFCESLFVDNGIRFTTVAYQALRLIF